MVTLAIKSNKVTSLVCAESSCKKHLNDLDIKNIGLDKEFLEKYEQMALNHAISQMDDLGWCPLNGCGSLATIEKDINQGRCQHCDFTFCLDCKDRYHPFKRCILNRLDLGNVLAETAEI
jgi:IBR domain, a half RING-finger domain